MALSFYDTSVGSYLQVLGGMAGVLERGETAAGELGLDLEKLVDYRLRDDMLPFSFQVISVWHHSLGAVKGMKAGVFEPPPRLEGMTYGKLRGLVDEAVDSLGGESRDEIDALSGRDMVFRVRGNEIPFTTDQFLVSFSLPNFYFHATTTYDILRLHGVPLSKMDYLGQLRSAKQ